MQLLGTYFDFITVVEYKEMEKPSHFSPRVNINFLLKQKHYVFKHKGWKLHLKLFMELHWMTEDLCWVYFGLECWICPKISYKGKHRSLTVWNSVSNAIRSSHMYSNLVTTQDSNQQEISFLSQKPIKTRLRGRLLQKTRHLVRKIITHVRVAGQLLLVFRSQVSQEKIHSVSHGMKIWTCDSS